MATSAGFRQQCPSCEAMVSVRDASFVGKKIDCPKCKYRFVVEEPPDEDDAYDRMLTQPAELTAAGVKVAIASFDNGFSRRIGQQALAGMGADEGGQGSPAGLKAVDRQAPEQAQAQEHDDRQHHQQRRAEAQDQPQPVPVRRDGQAGQLDLGDQVCLLIVHAISRPAERQARASNHF